MRNRNYFVRVLFSLIVGWGLAAPAMAQGEVSEHRLIRLGVFEVPPFSTINERGNWEGAGIELWQLVADELGLRTTIHGYSELVELREALAAGEVDVLLTIPATQEYETLMDLTQPYYRSGLGIAVDADALSGNWLRFLSGADFLSIVLMCAGLAGLWLVAGTIIYLLERRKNTRMFGGSVPGGIGQGVWWAAVTMTTVGYGDKAPLTPAGRLVAVFWMFASIVLISGLTASISASLTTDRLQGKVRGAHDLPQVRVGSLRDSRPMEWLAEIGASAWPYDSVDRGLQSLANQEIDAFVFDVAVLREVASRKFAGRVTVLPQVVKHYYVGMGVANGSELRETIDRSLLGVIAGDDWQRLLARHGLEE